MVCEISEVYLIREDLTVAEFYNEEVNSDWMVKHKNSEKVEFVFGMCKYRVKCWRTIRLRQRMLVADLHFRRIGCEWTVVSVCGGRVIWGGSYAEVFSRWKFPRGGKCAVTVV